jgi:hypothetical protein
MEWGVDRANGDGRNHGDNAKYIHWMVDLVFKPAHSTGHLGFESYYNEQTGSPWSLYAAPNARAAYSARYCAL